MAFNFNISMTLHLIFRAVRLVSLLFNSDGFMSESNYLFLCFQGSLMANMILGMIIMHKRYNFMKYASVAMISVGIAVCTMASGKDVGVSD